MKFLLPIIVIVILIVGYFGLKQVTKEKSIIPSEKTPSSISANQELKTFQSKLMKFSINVPSDFQIREELTFVDLEKNNAKINISKNSTNENDVNGYVKDFDKKRTGLSIEEEESVKIVNLDSVKRIEKFSAGPITQQKVYYIYTENKVYSISANEKELYDELDQIALSFRYIP